MLTDTRQAAGKDREEAIVIIGGGTVGLYLAALLSEKGRRVKVVESGNSILSSFTNESFRSIGRPHRGVSSGSTRALGGTSNLRGGQLVEFQPIDFGSRALPAMSEWPISYSEWAPYVRATYESLGINQAAQDDSAGGRARVGQVPDFPEGVEVFLTRWMKTPSMAVLYGQAIQDDTRLEVAPAFTVVGFQADEGRIIAVVAKHKEGRTVRIPGRTFVIAAGTVETVRLLLATAADQSWACPASQVRESLFESLTLLKRSRDDVFLVHEPTPADFVSPELVKSIEDLVAKGLTGCFGAGISACDAPSHTFGVVWQPGWPTPEGGQRGDAALRVYHGGLRGAARDSRGRFLKPPPVLLREALGIQSESLILVAASTPEKLSELVSDVTP